MERGRMGREAMAFREREIKAPGRGNWVVYVDSVMNGE